MKLIKHILITVFVFVTLSTFSQKQNFNWLLGNWKIVKTQGVIIENWIKQNDTTYLGKSYFVNKKDTSVDETIELVKQGIHWFYIVTTANQNDQKPVKFKIIFNGVNEFICTNLQHNYPQRIAYRLVGTSTLYASIEGSVNGKYKKGNYDFVKTN